MDFTKIVEEKMRKRKLKVSDLAKLTGYTYPYCYDLLKGKRRWNQDTIDKFCAALGIKTVFVDIDLPARDQQATG